MLLLTLLSSLPTPIMNNTVEYQVVVSDLHTLYVRESGNPKGVPVVQLHGGPGSQSKDSHREIFDLNLFRVIQIDQRGCGLSTPLGEIQENTTQDLVEDIERVREYLEIDQWIVSGASWGSTLALLYAEAYPERVRGLFVRSIFLARNQDIDWLHTGVAEFFPDLWEVRKQQMNELGVTSNDLSAKLFEMLQSDDIELQKKAVAIYASWEVNFLNLESRFMIPTVEEVDEAYIPGNLVYHHYDVNRFFVKENQILANVDKIRDIPTVIVHGRYDMICRPAQAYELYQELTNATLEITNFDGHSFGGETKRLMKYLVKTLA